MNERVDESLAPKESAPVAAKDFRCPNCGGPVNLSLPGKSQSVRCGHCGSILEPTHDVLLLRQKYEKAFNQKQWIPLGQEGVLKGIKFKCVGIVARKDNYGGSWTEYLIFNPYHGFRYLVESYGHWTYVEQLANLGYAPNNEPAWDGYSSKINFADKKFKYITAYQATVENVIGEFPWEVTIGERNAVTEYINPPYQATCERVESTRDGKFITTESNWSLGEYIYPEEIQKAFNLEEMPPRVGMGMCEPNPYKKRRFFALLWSAALFFFASATCVISSNRSENAKVIDKVLPLNIANFELKKDGATEYLEFDHEEGTIQLPKETNIEFKFSIPLNQEWVSLNVLLIDEATGKGFIYESQLSHYWGGSGEDAWSEGSDSTDFTTQAIPAGKYSVFLMGATNVGVLQFKRLLSLFGSRVALNTAVRTPKTVSGGGALHNATPTQAPGLNQAANPLGFVATDTKANTGRLLPLNFPNKESAPKLGLRMLAVRDVVDIGQNIWLFFLLLLGIGYYHIRYRMQEKKRLADDGDDSGSDEDEDDEEE